MIKLKSNKELMFPPMYKEIITMEIDLIQNKPQEGKYELRIIDTAQKTVEEEFEVEVLDENGNVTVDNKDKPITEIKTREVQKQVGTPVTRLKTMTYEELDALATILNVDMTDKAQLRENINELFRQGLLAITTKEASEGEGMYFSEVGDWEIVR